MITEFSRPRSDTPLIYISYGMMKCGSTLAFELTKGILEQNGFPQTRLPKSTIPGDAAQNFVTSLGLEQLEAIEREAEKRGYPIVLKTHHAPTPAVKAWVEEGRILGHCAYRDLREMALSLIDNGARSRARGGKGFSNIEDLEDALDSIRKQVPRFLAWARLPGFMPLYYNDVAFDTQNTVRRLCGQLGLDADPAKVEKIVKGERPTRYNKGVPGRFREMAAEDSELILQEFRSFYEEFIDPHGEPPQLPGATAADQAEYSAGGKPHRSWRLLRKFLGMVRRA
jgi:hypothetical protein